MSHKPPISYKNWNTQKDILVFMKNILSYEFGDEWYYMHIYYYASENSIIPNV